MTFERVLLLILACLPLLLSVTATCHAQETQLPAGVRAQESRRRDLTKCELCRTLRAAAVVAR